jgi:hypothetical protein
MLPVTARLGYWNHLYAYVDSRPFDLTDPLGLGIWEEILKRIGRGTPEKAGSQTIGDVLASGCIAQNCKGGRRVRKYIDAYGDCASLLDRITKEQNPYQFERWSGTSFTCRGVQRKRWTSRRCCRGM